MLREKCILCGRRYAAGLHILGCLICFPCEKRLTASAIPAGRRRRMLRLYRRTDRTSLNL